MFQSLRFGDVRGGWEELGVRGSGIGIQRVGSSRGLGGSGG